MNCREKLYQLIFHADDDDDEAKERTDKRTDRGCYRLTRGNWAKKSYEKFMAVTIFNYVALLFALRY